MKQHKHAEVLRAIADGKDVQYSRTEGCAWADYRKDGGGYDPLTHVDWFWRVKPERKPDVVRYGFLVLGVFEIMWTGHKTEQDNLALTFDGETGALKGAEVLK